MKVLFVEGYPGLRGAQRSLIALIEALAVDSAPVDSPSVDCEVLCTVEGRALDAYCATGVVVHPLPLPRSLAVFGGGLLASGWFGKLRRLPSLLRYGWRVGALLRRRRPDIVHCNQARAVLLVGPAARLLGLPVVWHLRGMLDLPPRVVRLVGRLATQIVCVSEAVRQSLPSSLAQDATVIANGIDAPSEVMPRHEARTSLDLDRWLAERRLPHDSLLLLTASSFVPYKGLHHVIDALSLIAAQRPDLFARLAWVVLGDDDGQPAKAAYRRRLLERWQERMPHSDVDDRILWAGWQDDTAPWFAAADLCLLPTVEGETWIDADGRTVELVCSEGFPRTLLEAMALGTPVIASDVAAVRQQVAHGESGLVVPPSDAAALADAVTHLADGGARRQSMAEVGRQRLEAFSVAAMGRAMVSLWRRVLATKS